MTERAFLDTHPVVRLPLEGGVRAVRLDRVQSMKEQSLVPERAARRQAERREGESPIRRRALVSPSAPRERSIARSSRAASAASEKRRSPHPRSRPTSTRGRSYSGQLPTRHLVLNVGRPLDRMLDMAASG